MNALFLIAFLLFIVTCLLLVLIWTIKNAITPTPTPAKIGRCVFKLLPSQFEGGIVELGSGWGTLAFPLAKKYPTCSVVGFENSPIPYIYSKIKLWLSSTPNLTFENKDFFQVSLKETNFVVCYLCPTAMQRLKTKLKDELQPGTLIVSHTFALPDWIPEKTVLVDDLYKTKIYLYRVR